MLSDIMTDHGDCRHCEARRRIRQSVRRLANRSWANLHVVARSDAKPAPAFAHRATARRFHGEWIAARSEARLRLLKPLNLETTMLLDHPSDEPTAIRTQFGAIFVSLELSRSNWLVTSLSPGKGEKMSKYRVAAGDMAELLTLFAELRRKAEIRTGQSYPIITIQEADRIALAGPDLRLAPEFRKQRQK